MGGGKKGALEGKCFCISGALSEGRKEIEKKIKSAGGSVASSVTSSVTHVITTKDTLEKTTDKIVEAESKGIPILSEDFLQYVFAQSSLPKSLDKYVLSRKEEAPQPAEMKSKKRKAESDSDSSGSDSDSDSGKKAKPPKKKAKTEKEEGKKKSSKGKSSKRKSSKGKSSDSDSDSGSSSESERDRKKRKSSSSKKPKKMLDKMVFCFTGKLSENRATLEKKIAEYGGSVASSITKSVTHVISTQDELEKKTEKMVEAKKKKIPLLSEKFLKYVFSKESLPESFEKYTLKPAESSDESSSDSSSDSDSSSSDSDSSKGKKNNLKAPGKPLSGMTFCITGTLSQPRKDYEAMLKKYGGSVAASLTNSVTHLVTVPNPDRTSKLKNAEKKGVKIWTEEDVNRLIHVSSSSSESEEENSADGGQPAKSISKLLKKALPHIKEFAKLAYIPKVEKGDCGVTESKFGGIPYLAEGEQWPRCGNSECSDGSLMQFFFQIDLAKLPESAQKTFGSKGLFQYWKCANNGNNHGWDEFDKGSLCRIIQVPSGSSPRKISMPSFDPSDDVIEPFSPKRVVGWIEQEDFPGAEDNDDLLDKLKTKMKLNEDQLDEITDEMQDDLCVRTDKLGGYPDWIQGANYPSCPKCSQPMQFIWQIESENICEYMWGDVGAAQIMQCQTHKDIMTSVASCC